MSTAIIENEYATLWYHPDSKIVHHRIYKPIGGQTFRDVMNKGAEVFQKFGAQKWLSDDRGNSALSPEDSDWGTNDWTPRVIAAGWKYWAVIMPEKVIGQINMQRFIKANSELGVVTQVFSDPDEALRWLETQ